MNGQTMFLGATVAAVVLAGAVDALVAPLDVRAETKPLVGVIAGCAFMWIMNATGVVPVVPAVAFAVPWALAHVFSAPYYGVATGRERLKRASLAVACGGLGVLSTLDV